MSWWCSLCAVTVCVFDFCSTMTSPFLVHLQCSKTCGRGLRKRSVFCSSTDPGAKAVVVPDSMCRQHLKPKAQETCVLRRCPKNERLQWIPTPWGAVRMKQTWSSGFAIEVTHVVFIRIILRKNPPWSTRYLLLETALDDAPCFAGSFCCLVVRVWKCRGRNLTMKRFPHSFDLHLHQTCKHQAVMSLPQN